MIGTAILTALLLEELELLGGVVVALLCGGLYLKSCSSLGSTKPGEEGVAIVAPPSELRE